MLACKNTEQTAGLAEQEEFSEGRHLLLGFSARLSIRWHCCVVEQTRKEEGKLHRLVEPKHRHVGGPKFLCLLRLLM